MSFNFQLARPRIPFFPKWSKITKPFTKEKHYLKDGQIFYDVKNGENYANHIEMSGFQCSSIISYGCNENRKLMLNRHIVFPNLRMYPNLTHNSLDCNFKGVTFFADNKKVNEKAICFKFDGILTIFTEFENLKIERKIFTSRNKKACIEIVKFTNTGNKDISVFCKYKSRIKTPKYYGVDRKSYRLFTKSNIDSCTIYAKKSTTFEISYSASETDEIGTINCTKEYSDRITFLKSLQDIFVAETPENTINTAAQYAKIRACESIYKTKSGLMHSPGGGSYYAALWTNDQCEYINPLFAYLGYDVGVKQSLNCYKLYQKYISKDKALISSIISGGDGIWHGAKDRGDSVMYAYGCSRFLLSNGDKKTALKYIDSIRDCLSYTMSKINSDGVVESDSDELENRFESGKANLCTSCLAYDALISASYMEDELGNSKNANKYRENAEKLKKNINLYFGKNVENYDTYMYCKEETRLRSWISMPLTVGIFDKSDETVKALISPKLHLNEGLVTRSGEKTFWDRSTLYSLRGIFYSHNQNEGIELLETYSRARLLGEHIPYPVEAFPEGNQAQLSAESGLYLRIFSEGILGYRPIGFNSFELKPNLPQKWNFKNLKNITLCGKVISIYVKRNDNGYNLTYTYNSKKIEINDIKDKVIIELSA